MTSYWLRMLGESIILGQLQFLTKILAKGRIHCLKFEFKFALKANILTRDGY